MRRAYREMIEAMDEGVGQVLAALERTAQARRTLVFFFSDNGATRVGSNGRLRGNKGSLWEGGQRVPAMAWWPGTIPAGRVCTETAMAIDLMPTMMEVAGAKVEESMDLDGVSLLSTLTEGVAVGGRSLFWEYRRQRAMREGDWKLVTGLPETGDVGLYDLGVDPSERHNVAGKHPARAARMRAELLAWADDVQNGATRQPDRPDGDRMTRRGNETSRLRSRGSAGPREREKVIGDAVGKVVFGGEAIEQVRQRNVRPFGGDGRLEIDRIFRGRRRVAVCGDELYR